MKIFRIHNVWRLITALAFMQGSLAQVTDTGDEVGVGTSSPEEKLHVMGGGLLVEMQSNYNPDPRIVLNNDGAGANPYLTFYRWTGNSNTYYATRFYDAGNQGFKIQNSNTATFGNHTFSDAITFLRNGDVGIGTSNPGAKLHIYGNTAGMGNIISSIMIGRVRGPEIQAIQEGADEDVQGLAFRVKSSAAFADPNFEAMRISRNGNLGIGTTDPGNYKLAVKGKIRAEEIKVETGWADYVFKENYHLPSLEEVEKHIKENGRLINIPSAEEVAETGVELGKMNKLLLEKIEELTLYTIQQQKEIQQYQVDMSHLNKKLEAMQQQINNLKN